VNGAGCCGVVGSVASSRSEPGVGRVVPDSARGRVLAECVINIAEGRDRRIVGAVARAGDGVLLDVHSDPDHHRSVLTLGGRLEVVEPAARRVAAAAVARIDLRAHTGVHPRLGAVDVVPFVALPDRPATGSSETDAWDAVLGARDAFARWAGAELGLPCFLYGPERSLPEVRRTAFTSLRPAAGPAAPHPTVGATAVGARPVLVAYNVWITAGTGERSAPPGRQALSAARSVAARVRGPGVRSLGLAVGPGAQVSLNLIDTALAPLADVYDQVAAQVEALGCTVVRGELVGLCPADVVASVPRHRWPELDLSEDRTIEARLARA
jgi:glutamate formiminotransferase / 5-formyltetrahydrofolate cyclo-ligase